MLALSDNSFNKFRLTNPFLVYVNKDTNIFKFFNVEQLLNKCIINHDCCQLIEYLIRQKSYSPKWNKQYNIKDLNNFFELVRNYKQDLI